MKSGLSLIIGLAVGGALGYALVNALRPGDVVAGLTPAESPTDAAGQAREARASEVRLIDERAPAPARAPDELRGVAEDEPLISARLREYADEGLARGWSAVRPDAIPPAILERGGDEFEEAVLALPEGLGRALGAKQTEREEALADARTGGVFALLETLGKGVGPVVDLVRDRDEFEGFFRREAPETFIGGTAIGRADLSGIVAGSTLSFPAGVFALNDLVRYWKDVPRDVTIAGTGMDVTLLVVGDISFGRELRNFAFERCTVYTDGDSLFDLRREAAQARMEEVRLVGFDSGAGGSSAFNTRALAVHVVRSRILGGYGRSPGSGELFDVRTPALIARFDDCTIEQVEIGAFRQGATVVFSNCTLRDVLDQKDPSDADGVVFDHCSVSLFQGASEELPKLDLNDLFPDWKEQMVK